MINIKKLLSKMKKIELETEIKKLQNDIQMLNLKYEDLLQEILERDKISPFQIP